jgi:molybdopterin-guanine dinucleotide biosynthesis protein A
MRNAKIDAVLLVGGESRRMGQDKATFEFRGRPLWENQLALLKKLKPIQIFVSARADPLWRPNDTIFVADEAPSRGPLSGLAATFRKTHSTHLLALAIDLPWMSADYLGALWNQIAKGCGVVPTIGDRAEPLAAIYPFEAAIDFATALSGIDHSLQSVVRILAQSGKVRLVDVADQEKELFRNLNSPADLLK